jgi:hypothetical protein
LALPPFAERDHPADGHHHVPSELHAGDLRRGGRPSRGHIFEAVRYTALHPAPEKAEFEDVGQWLRPWYFPKNGETCTAVNRECLAVRNSVGLLDASTLGKIDIQGPDAREFLNRIYTNAWSKLDVGKARYGLMCENGMVIDDGVTACLADNHFHMTTTTGGAARAMAGDLPPDRMAGAEGVLHPSPTTGPP